MRSCEVCGAEHPRLLLLSPRLDGPLVRCRECGLVYVGTRTTDFTFEDSDSARTQALGDRVSELGIVDRRVEAAEEPRRLATELARVQRLRRYVDSGRLLDVGCAGGALLAAAGAHFDAQGVEPDPGTSDMARAAGLSVRTGTFQTVAAEQGGFDAITMIHVLEHLDSPRAALVHARELLDPGGVLLIETPTVDNLWFRLAPSRWRQLIPDHYFFFSRDTLERLLRRCDLQPVEHVKVGRRVSVRFAADRLRRAGIPGARLAARAVEAAHLGDRGIYLNPGDIMQVIARPT